MLQPAKVADYSLATSLTHARFLRYLNSAAWLIEVGDSTESDRERKLRKLPT